MPINYARRLTGKQRSLSANRQLGLTLCFVAGAINAGGFLAVHQYTSHMTGIVSSIADNFALGTMDLGLAGLAALLAFILGAICSTILISHTRQRTMNSEYAFPLLLEALLLLVFGPVGAHLDMTDGVSVSLTVALLAFIMGLQNAVITKLSNAEIRTTHVTGIVTDIGIEVGRLLYGHFAPSAAFPASVPVPARLRLLLGLVGCFFTGGVVGALGFRLMGYFATVPLSLVLIVLAGVPVIDDLRLYLRGRLHPDSRE